MTDRLDRHGTAGWGQTTSLSRCARQLTNGKAREPGQQFASAGLTLRAMAIATTVIRDGIEMSAPCALIDESAKCGRATACNGLQDLSMCPTEPLAVALDESSA
jgi:hypothetical protein